MDVTSESFSYWLPRILDNLATCVFVAIDFEFSGIARSPRGPVSTGTPTLQQRYEEVKGAAERYQIIQVGLTVCHEDTETATYTLKPFNIYISPIIEQRLEVERECTLQSSAIEFLLKNNFRLDIIYKNGVRYLSRQEEAMAMAKAVERRDRKALHHTLDVKETDYESLQFLKAVRQVINEWLALVPTSDSYLNIPPPSSQYATRSSHSLPTTLNRFQKRLVHQLVEVEYPSLAVTPNSDFMQVMIRSEAREQVLKEERMKRTEQYVWKETGFRWIAEALAGGDLTNIDTSYFVGIMSTSAAVKKTHSLKEFCNKLKQQLKAHRPVLVGHNIFSDLVYFYQCFFGPLPDRVEDFQEKIHEMFPVLMDTKYMATHDCGSINPTSSLSDIVTSLAQISVPRIIIDPEHSKYDRKKTEHEAGYDSLLTAQAFIKLSAQLRDGRASTQLEKLPMPSPVNQRLADVRPDEDSENSSTSPVPRSSSSPMSTHDGTWPKQKSRDGGRGEAKPKKKQGHGSRFDVLVVEDTPDEDTVSLPTRIPGDIASKVANGLLIPRLGEEFWNVYGNKVRVFGTEERVCILGKKAETAISEGLASVNLA